MIRRASFADCRSSRASSPRPLSRKTAVEVEVVLEPYEKGFSDMSSGARADGARARGISDNLSPGLVKFTRERHARHGQVLDVEVLTVEIEPESPDKEPSVNARHSTVAFRVNDSSSATWPPGRRS